MLISFIFSHCSLDLVRAELLPVFSYLMQDDQYTVRMLAAEACVQVTRVLPRGEATSEVLPLLAGAARDRSWRVRSVIADKWAELQTSLGTDVMRADLVPVLVRLLQDQEPEVRSQMASRLPDVGTELSGDDRATLITQHVLPYVGELLSDMCVIFL